MVTGSTRGVPVHRLAWAGIVTAVFAGLLALYGSMHAEKHFAHSPLREAREQAVLPPRQQEPFGEYVRTRSAEETARSRASRGWRWVSTTWHTMVAAVQWGDRWILTHTTNSKIANSSLQIFVYVLPFVLGVGAALTGGSAMNAVQRSGGRCVGNTLAVFSMLVGGLAAVVAGCMMIALYVWPRVPSLYTT